MVNNMTIDCNFAGWSRGEEGGDRCVCTLRLSGPSWILSLAPTCDQEKCVLMRMIRALNGIPQPLAMVLDTPGISTKATSPPEMPEVECKHKWFSESSNKDGLTQRCIKCNAQRITPIQTQEFEIPGKNDWKWVGEGFGGIRPDSKAVKFEVVRRDEAEAKLKEQERIWQTNAEEYDTKWGSLEKKLSLAERKQQDTEKMYNALAQNHRETKEKLVALQQSPGNWIDADTAKAMLDKQNAEIGEKSRRIAELESQLTPQVDPQIPHHILKDGEELGPCDRYPKQIGKKLANSCVGCTVGCLGKGKQEPEEKS